VPAYEQRVARRAQHGRGRFQAINDQYGHAVGDRVLASVAAVIRKELRQMDILTRYAGDEFVAIMPMASSSMAQVVGERMRTAVESQRFSVRTGTVVQVASASGYRLPSLIRVRH